MNTNESMIEALDGLCRFASVAEPSENECAPYGREVNGALRYALELCESFGFRTKNCDNKIGYAEIGQGEEIIGILVHLDVVPAGSGWDYEPYAATCDGDRIYGRGVSDDKGPAITCIYAMKDLLDSGAAINRRVRIIFGQTEESGDWTDMDYYKATEELPVMGFTPDGDFPAMYGEKGIAIMRLTMAAEAAGFLTAQAGVAANVVPDQAGASLRTKDGTVREFSAGGKSAHASMPEDGDNAISHLMEQIAASGLPCGFADFYQDCIGFDYNGGRAGIGFEDGQSGKLTLNAGMLRLEGENCELTVDVRYPVTYKLDQVVDALGERVRPYGVTLEVMEQIGPVYMAKDGELITALLKVYRDLTGDDSEPTVVGGGTYARAMDNIVAFGPMLPGRELTEHQKNEYILREDFFLLREIYRKAIEALAGGK